MTPPVVARRLLAAYGAMNVVAGVAWTLAFSHEGNALPGLLVLSPMVAIVGGLIVFYRDGILTRVVERVLAGGEPQVALPALPGHLASPWPKAASRTAVLFAGFAAVALGVDAASGGALLSDADSGGWLAGPIWAGLGLLDLIRSAITRMRERRRSVVALTEEPPWWRRPRSAPSREHSDARLGERRGRRL